MANTGVLKKGLILFAILVLPSIGYVLLTRGKNNFRHLLFYGPKELASNGKDTLYHTLPEFSFTNQEGKTISSETDLKNKIIVADFFFVTCPSICPKMTAGLFKVQKKFESLRELRILSFSVNPDHDSVSVLANYGKTHMVNPRKWFLLTGNKKQIYDLARKGFLLPVQEGNGDSNDFIHSEQVVLLDKERHIRGFYDGTDPNEIDRLNDEIIVLQLEYKEKQAKQ